MKSINQIALEYLYEQGNPDDLEAWIVNELGKPAPHHDLLFEIFHKPKYDWGNIAIELAETLNDFKFVSAEGAVYARQLLQRLCQQILSEEITPFNFCRIFSYIENDFLCENLQNDIDVSWLGDLYNACDWCDETWTKDNSPYLIDEVEAVISHISRLDMPTEMMDK